MDMFSSKVNANAHVMFRNGTWSKTIKLKINISKKDRNVPATNFLLIQFLQNVMNLLR